MPGDVTRIAVTGESPYEVVVGADVLDEVRALLGEGVRRVGVVHPLQLTAGAQQMRDTLAAAGLDAHLVVVPDGEAAKTAGVASRCWAALGRYGFTRSDAVVGLGGGATTDVAGFVAATFLRGLRLVQVPTTLLGMVDAAVGGKTGINTAEGKNLVGAFHEPAGVVCDLTWLRTLPRRDLVAGLAEVVKCGFVLDPPILDTVVADPDAATDAASDTLRSLVEAAITVKARVVSADLREATSTDDRLGREALNYGHTLGHAVERVEQFRIRHGEAVSIGMVYVAELARLAGRLDAASASRHREVLELLGLPTSYPAGRWQRLREAMRVDKKARGDVLRFVVLTAVGRPVILSGPEESLLEAAYNALSR